MTFASGGGAGGGARNSVGRGETAREGGCNGGGGGSAGGGDDLEGDSGDDGEGIGFGNACMGGRGTVTPSTGTPVPFSPSCVIDLVALDS